MNNQYERLVPLYGEANLKKLHNATVAVIGLGGVGAYAVEALARMGIGKLIVIDKDRIMESNINRLIYATHDTIGLYKSDLAKARIKSINPQCEVVDYALNFDETMVETLFAHPIDFIFDAIDSLKDKVLLIENCHRRNIPFIVSTGQGNRWHSERITIKNLSDTSYDPLARKLRKLLRHKGICSKIPVVFSDEHPLKDNTLSFVASNPFGPATAGLRAAEYITKNLME